MYRNLRDFIRSLDRAGELKYINYKVSPYIEISKITDQESKSPNGGKALFFEHIEGSSFPVVTNIFGSFRRICMALGVNHLDRLSEKIKKYIDINPPRSLREALNIIPMAINFTKFFPRSCRSKIPPCQEVVYQGDEVDLSKIPVLHCWPKDAAPFITMPMVFTKSLITGKRNVGMYRMQIFNKNSTGMHWHVHKDGSHYFNEYRRIGKRMPVAVTIGADPASIYSATAPMPRGIDEMLLAGFIHQRPVLMTKCLTIDMEVPSEAEFVLEGYVDPDELRLEGPFGDHTGYYSVADYYPVFHVIAVTHRKNPIYNATLVGRPPMEDCYLAKATERLFLPMLQTIMPEICDYWFPWEGVFHNIVIVSIDKEYSGHAQKVMSGLWGQGQMSFCKAIVVVDKNINPQNQGRVIEELVTKLDITSDITLTKGVLDVLDHSSSLPNFGSKIGIDLTTRFKDELPRKDKELLNKKPDIDLTAILKKRLPGFVKYRYLFQNISKKEKSLNNIIAISKENKEQKSGEDFATILFGINELELFNIFILFDSVIDLSDDSLMLWKVFNNVDPERDMIFQDSRVVINACKKGMKDGYEREWPDDLTFDV